MTVLYVPQRRLLSDDLGVFCCPGGGHGDVRWSHDGQAGAASDHAVNQARQWEEAAPGTGMLAGVVNSIPSQLSGAFGSLAGMTAADTALVTQLSDKLPEYTAPETAIGAARLTNPVSVAEREAQLDQSASHTASGRSQAAYSQIPVQTLLTLYRRILYCR